MSEVLPPPPIRQYTPAQKALGWIASGIAAFGATGIFISNEVGGGAPERPSLGEAPAVTAAPQVLPRILSSDDHVVPMRLSCRKGDRKLVSYIAPGRTLEVIVPSENSETGETALLFSQFGPNIVQINSSYDEGAVSEIDDNGDIIGHNNVTVGVDRYQSVHAEIRINVDDINESGLTTQVIAHCVRD